LLTHSTDETSDLSVTLPVQPHSEYFCTTTRACHHAMTSMTQFAHSRSVVPIRDTPAFLTVSHFLLPHFQSPPCDKGYTNVTPSTFKRRLNARLFSRAYDVSLDIYDDYRPSLYVKWISIRVRCHPLYFAFVFCYCMSPLLYFYTFVISDTEIDLFTYLLTYLKRTLTWCRRIGATLHNTQLQNDDNDKQQEAAKLTIVPSRVCCSCEQPA